MAEQQVGGAGGALEQHGVAGAVGEFVEERTQRCDADSGREQGDFASFEDGSGEPAVGAFEQCGGAGPQGGQPAAAGAEVLRGDPQPVPVRGGREGERLAARPARARDEPPDEELARRDGKPVEVPAAQVDRDDAAAFGHDPLDDQPVPGVEPSRPSDAEHEHGTRRGGVRGPPERGRRGGGGEVGAGPQLVRQGQAGAEVGVEVQQVPGLVAQPAPGRAHRRHGDHEQRDGSGGRQEHARVGRDQVPRLTKDAGAVGRRVAEGDEHDVGGQQGDRSEPDEPVPAGQLVLAVAAFDPRDARHQQDLQQQEVGGQQPGEPAGRGEEVRAEVLQAAAGHPERDHEQDAQPGRQPGGVPPPRADHGPRDATGGETGGHRTPQGDCCEIHPSRAGLAVDVTRVRVR